MDENDVEDIRTGSDFNVHRLISIFVKFSSFLFSIEIAITKNHLFIIPKK